MLTECTGGGCGLLPPATFDCPVSRHPLKMRACKIVCVLAVAFVGCDGPSVGPDATVPRGGQTVECSIQLQQRRTERSTGEAIRETRWYAELVDPSIRLNSEVRAVGCDPEYFGSLPWEPSPCPEGVTCTGDPSVILQPEACVTLLPSFDEGVALAYCGGRTTALTDVITPISGARYHRVTFFIR